MTKNEMMKIIETYSEGDYLDFEVFQCDRCGRTYTLSAGGEPSCCVCEFEEEN